VKVILTQNVAKLGNVGDICNVADGFGRNYLMPQGLAILATESAAKQIDDLRRTDAKRQARIQLEMEALAKQIQGLPLLFKARVGETGRLYGSITSSDIAAAIEEALGVAVDRRKIELDETIRSLGAHAVPVHLHHGVTATANVTVEADGELVRDLPVEPEPEPEDYDEDEDEDDDDYDDYDDEDY